MLAALALVALHLAQKPSQDPCTAFRQKVHDVYNFRPSHLSAAQQKDKAAQMDEVWSMVKGNTSTYLPCLRTALQDPKSDGWFRVDGSGLLCEIDPSLEAKQIRLSIWLDAEWADLAPEVWVSTMAELGAAGLDTSRAGKRWLDDPSGKFYVAEHALQVGPTAGALFLFGSMDETFAAPMLAKMAADPKQKSRDDAIHILAALATPEALNALMTLEPKNVSKPVRIRVSQMLSEGSALSKKGASSGATREKLLAAFAAFLKGDHKLLDATQELSNGKPDPDWFGRLAGLLSQEDIPLLRQVRRKRMTFMSDEALDDYLQYTRVLLSFERTPEIVKWATEFAR
jgi:hypothetical protein